MCAPTPTYDRTLACRRVLRRASHRSVLHANGVATRWAYCVGPNSTSARRRRGRGDYHGSGRLRACVRRTSREWLQRLPSGGRAGWRHARRHGRRQPHGPSLRLNRDPSDIPHRGAAGPAGRIPRGIPRARGATAAGADRVGLGPSVRPPSLTVRRRAARQDGKTRNKILSLVGHMSK